jgi:hypothetical protein
VEERRSLIIDANVLIDYAHTQPKILILAGRHIGTLHVSRLLLQQEVCELNESDGDQLGLNLVELSTEQLLEVGRLRRSLSFHDRTCLVLAEEPLVAANMAILCENQY